MNVNNLEMLEAASVLLSMANAAVVCQPNQEEMMPPSKDEEVVVPKKAKNSKVYQLHQNHFEKSDKNLLEPSE